MLSSALSYFVDRAAKMRDRMKYWPTVRVATAVSSSASVDGTASLPESAEAPLPKPSSDAPGLGPSLLEDAFAAERLGDFDELLSRARLAWEKAPSFPLAHAVYGGALRKKRRYAEARSVLEGALAQFPDVREIIIEEAALMQATNDWREAERKWILVIERFPGRVEGPVGLASALRSQLKFDEADATLVRAREHFDKQVLIHTHFAVNADARGDREEALRRWAEVRKRFGNLAVAHAGYGAALKALGRHDQADEVFARAMRRFPGDANLGVNHAWNAEAQGKWEEAEARWHDLAERFPADARVREGLSECSMKARLASLDTSQPSTVPLRWEASPSTVPLKELAPHDLMTRFESLGDNCELGFVQRHFHAEPLGLIRWAGISLRQLIEGLDTDFVGVGDPKFTKMAVNPSNHEYYTEDSRFGLSMHSFILRDEPNETKIYGKLCARLRYLKDRLLEGMSEGQKIFVFQSGQAIGEADVLRLHAALQRHGANTLLVVGTAGDGHPPASVEFSGERLYHGYLSKIGYDGKLWDIRFDEWLVICTEVYRHRYAGAAAVLTGE